MLLCVCCSFIHSDGQQYAYYDISKEIRRLYNIIWVKRVAYAT